MTKTEREDLASLVRRIPCELSISTYNILKNASTWIGCRECVRCLLLMYLESDLDSSRGRVRDEILNRPENGGYVILESPRKE